MEKTQIPDYLTKHKLDEASLALVLVPYLSYRALLLSLRVSSGACFSMVALSTSCFPLFKVDNNFSSCRLHGRRKAMPSLDDGQRQLTSESQLIWNSIALIFHVSGKLEEAVSDFTSTKLMNLLDRARFAVIVAHYYIVPLWPSLDCV